MKPDLQQLISDCSSELSDISQRIAGLSPLDNLKLYLTNYALIKACGTIEFTYKAIVADFFDQFASPQIETYLEKTIRKASSSALYSNMCDMLGKFDGAWTSNFKQTVEANPDKQRLISSVSSLVNNRHSFAHGLNPTATFSDIHQYFKDGIILIQIFDTIVR